MLDPASLVGAGGRLVLDEPGIVVTGGARVLRRRIIVKLEQDAVAAVRDAVVLGKAGEHSSVVDPQLVATLGASPLLEDALRIDPARDASHSARRGGDHDRVGFGVGDAAAGYGLQLAPPTAFGGPGFRAPARDRSSP